MIAKIFLKEGYSFGVQKFSPKSKYFGHCHSSVSLFKQTGVGNEWLKSAITVTDEGLCPTYFFNTKYSLIIILYIRIDNKEKNSFIQINLMPYIQLSVLFVVGRWRIQGTDRPKLYQGEVKACFLVKLTTQIILFPIKFLLGLHSGIGFGLIGNRKNEKGS